MGSSAPKHKPRAKKTKKVKNAETPVTGTVVNGGTFLPPKQPLMGIIQRHAPPTPEGSASTVEEKKICSPRKRAEKFTVLSEGVFTALDQAPEFIEPPEHIDVPVLHHGLDRVLFNPGVHFLRDPRSKVYNFTPNLRFIAQPQDFNFDALPNFTPPSKDMTLHDLSKSRGAKFAGSTSSVSSALSQIYLALSSFKDLSTDGLSTEFIDTRKSFTQLTQLPTSVILKKQPNGVYTIDQFKSVQDRETIMMKQGVILEHFFTRPFDDFEKLLNENKGELDKLQPREDAYAYCRYGDLLLRSQIDCKHPYLPRKVFDLKTRATVAVRLNAEDYADFVNYRVFRLNGMWNSFMREFYDMMRSAFLKYNFQVRIGNMDGLFVAYHNTQEIFGFQYVSREELDQALFGSTALGDQSFVLSLACMNMCFNQAVREFPDDDFIKVVFAADSVGLDVYARRLKDGTENLEDEIAEEDVQRWNIQMNRMKNGEFVSTIDDFAETDALDIRYIMQKADSNPAKKYSSLVKRVSKRLSRTRTPEEALMLKRLFSARFTEADLEESIPLVLT